MTHPSVIPSEVEGSRFEDMAAEIPPLRSQARYGRDDKGKRQSQERSASFASSGRRPEAYTEGEARTMSDVQARSQMSRRRFLTTFGTVAAAMAVLQACTPTAPTTPATPA